MKEVDARILPPPELKYAINIAKVNKGTWFLQPFRVAKSLNNKEWTILDLSRSPYITSENIGSLITTFMRSG